VFLPRTGFPVAYRLQNMIPEELMRAGIVCQSENLACAA
jgi:hypothetical protein